MEDMVNIKQRGFNKIYVGDYNDYLFLQGKWK